MRLRMAKGLCAAGLMFACCGCSSSSYDDEAVEALVSGYNNLYSSNSMAISADLIFNSEEDGMPIKATISLEGEANYEKLEDLQMKFNMGMNANGLAFNDFANIYVKDNTLYMDIMEEKQKQAFPEELPIFDDLPDMNFDVDADLLKDSFKYIQFEDKEKGIIKMEMNDSAYNSFLTGMRQGASDSDLKDYTITMTVKNDQLSEINITLDMVVEGEPMEMEFAIALDKFNEIKAIEFPDLKDYKENNDDSLLGEGLDYYF